MIWYGRRELKHQTRCQWWSLLFRSSEYKEITDLRTLGWPIQINGTFWNILGSCIINRLNTLLIGYYSQPPQNYRIHRKDLWFLKKVILDLFRSSLTHSLHLCSIQGYKGCWPRLNVNSPALDSVLRQTSCKIIFFSIDHFYEVSRTTY